MWGCYQFSQLRRTIIALVIVPYLPVVIIRNQRIIRVKTCDYQFPTTEDRLSAVSDRFRTILEVQEMPRQNVLLIPKNLDECQ